MIGQPQRRRPSLPGIRNYLAELEGIDLSSLVSNPQRVADQAEEEMLLAGQVTHPALAPVTPEAVLRAGATDELIDPAAMPPAAMPPGAAPAASQNFSQFFDEINKRYPQFAYQPTPEEIAQLTAARGRPEASLPLALGAMLSRDEGLSRVGTGLYNAVEASRQPFEYAEGMVDPRTGQYTPDRFKAAQREQERLKTVLTEAAAAQRSQVNADAYAKRATLNAQQKLAPKVSAWMHTGTGLPVVTSIDGTPMIKRQGQEYEPVPFESLHNSTDGRKLLADARGDYSSAQRAESLLEMVNANPEAFGLTEKVVSWSPAFIRSWVRSERVKAGSPGDEAGFFSLIPLTPEQSELQANLSKEAALLVNKLYGAVVSRGEEKRAEDFIPKASDSFFDLMPKIAGLLDLARADMGRYPSWVLELAEQQLEGNPYNQIGGSKTSGDGQGGSQATGDSGPTEEEIQQRILQNRGGGA